MPLPWKLEKSVSRNEDSRAPQPDFRVTTPLTQQLCHNTSVMGELDPHNMLQVQRWRRKNKKAGKKKRKSYVTGKVIDGRHEMYTLSIAMMLGIRTSIARTNTIIASSDRRNMLTPQDFMAEEKYEFAPKVRVCRFGLATVYIDPHFVAPSIGLGNNSATQIVTHFQIQGLRTSGVCMSSTHVWCERV